MPHGYVQKCGVRVCSWYTFSFEHHKNGENSPGVCFCTRQTWEALRFFSGAPFFVGFEGKPKRKPKSIRGGFLKRQATHMETILTSIASGLASPALGESPGERLTVCRDPSA